MVLTMSDRDQTEMSAESTAQPPESSDRSGIGEQSEAWLVATTGSAGSAASAGTVESAHGTHHDEPELAVARMGDPVTVWPCANCGRPVPQPPGGTRVVRYCQDNDGACAREARDRRERGRDAPGLTGQVAWTWEMVERMEKMADLLADSLTSELSVAGVERRVAEVRAEAASHIATAQEEREASQRRAEAAWHEAASARTRAERSEQAAAQARTQAEQAIAERDALKAETEQARRIAEEATISAKAAEQERDRVAA